MQADFNVVLEMAWHLQWRPVSDWDTLDWFVNAPDDTKRIEFNPDLNGNVKIVDKTSTAKKLKRIARKSLRLIAMEEYRGDLTLIYISEKDVKRTLKKQDGQAVLYYAKKSFQGEERDQPGYLDS
jgi:hypothetical protein